VIGIIAKIFYRHTKKQKFLAAKTTDFLSSHTPTEKRNSASLWQRRGAKPFQFQNLRHKQH
jgi:hypothetical protein